MHTNTSTYISAVRKLSEKFLRLFCTSSYFKKIKWMLVTSMSFFTVLFLACSSKIQNHNYIALLQISKIYTIFQIFNRFVLLAIYLQLISCKPSLLPQEYNVIAIKCQTVQTIIRC